MIEWLSCELETHTVVCQECMIWIFLVMDSYLLVMADADKIKDHFNFFFILF